MREPAIGNRPDGVRVHVWVVAVALEQRLAADQLARFGQLPDDRLDLAHQLGPLLPEEHLSGIRVVPDQQHVLHGALLTVRAPGGGRVSSLRRSERRSLDIGSSRRGSARRRSPGGGYEDAGTRVPLSAGVRGGVPRGRRRSAAPKPATWATNSTRATPMTIRLGT